MKKLNNKGMTIIELLVSFILLIIIMASLYNTVFVYRIRQNVESYRSKALSYKNLLTKEIQDDIIKKGLIHVDIVNNSTNTDDFSNYNNKDIDVNLLFKDGSKKVIKVIAKYAWDYGVCNNSTDNKCNFDQDDMFSIGYGTSIDSDDYTVYKLPDLGYGFNGNKKCSDKRGCKILDFRINNVYIDVEDNIFTFYIGFYHPNFLNRYCISIVTPIKLV